MKKIEEILLQYKPISLQEMESVTLLNRTDTKYTINIKNLPELLGKIKPDYYVLKIDNLVIFRYETLYYDTEDLNMFLAHHNGKLNRYKIRKREYVDSGLNFLEIKFKNNKGRTIKDRICNEKFFADLSEQDKEFISDYSPYGQQELTGKMYTNFKRFTLVSNKKDERITIDLDLSFKNNLKSISIPEISIIEVKRDKHSNYSVMLNHFRQNKIFPNSISKYCFGTAFLDPTVKKNNYKAKINQLKKL